MGNCCFEREGRRGAGKEGFVCGGTRQHHFRSVVPLMVDQYVAGKYVATYVHDFDFEANLSRPQSCVNTVDLRWLDKVMIGFKTGTFIWFVFVYYHRAQERTCLTE